MSEPSLSDSIDVVDARDEPIGIVERGKLSSTQNFRVAHVFVFNKNGSLLLAKLGRVRTNDPGAWGSSVAAQVLHDETYIAAAARRLWEELGIGSVPLRFAGISRMHEGEHLKFVGLFVAQSEVAVIGEPDHVAGLTWRTISQLETDLLDSPNKFTDTFRFLLGQYLSSPIR